MGWGYEGSIKGEQTVKFLLKKAWNYRLVILIVLWLLYIINYFDRMAVITLMPFIQEDLNLTPIQVGQLTSAFFFAYSIALLVSGILADKIGSKKVMGIAIIIFTAFTAVTGTIKSFWQFFIFRIGLGLGEGQHYAPASRTIQNWFPRTERGRASAFFGTSWTLSGAIVPLLITTISIYFFNGEWRPVFYVLAVPGIIGILLLWFLIYDSPKEMLRKNKLTAPEYNQIAEKLDNNQEQGSNKKGNGTITDFLKDRNFYFMSILLFCHQSIYWGTNTWLTTFLVKQHGLNIKEMGFFVSAPYIIAVFATLIGGLLMDKVFYRMKPIALIGYFGCIPVLWLLGSLESNNKFILLTLLLCMGFFVNINWGTNLAYLQNRYASSVIGKAIGIASAVGHMGAFASPLISGYLVKVNTDGTQDFKTVFIFLACIATVAALLAVLLKEKKVGNIFKSSSVKQEHIG